jgi:hypothetical protein
MKEYTYVDDHTKVVRTQIVPAKVNEIIQRLEPAERKKVEDRATEIIAEEMSLRDLRTPRAPSACFGSGFPH